MTQPSNLQQPLDPKRVKTLVYVHGKQVLERFETPLFAGWRPSDKWEITILEKMPLIQWTGHPIPFALWQQILAFLFWSQDQFKQESLVTLFYHETDGWAAWVFPQEPNHMTVKLLTDDPSFNPDRARFGKGWTQAGSVHHHCTSSAFQSGVDRADEETKEGVHITVGNLDKPTAVSLHIRQVLGGVMQDTYMEAWIGPPTWFTEIPAHINTDGLFKSCLCHIDKAEFPAEWKTRVKPKTYVGQHYGAWNEGRWHKDATGKWVGPEVSNGRQAQTQLSLPHGKDKKKNKHRSRILEHAGKTFDELVAILDDLVKLTGLREADIYELLCDKPLARDSFTPEEVAIRAGIQESLDVDNVTPLVLRTFILDCMARTQ